jgi:vancomycin resistance protein YoaR
LGLLGVGGAMALGRDVVPRGTTVGGVEVGGLTRADAVQALSARAPTATAPVPVQVGDRQASLDPAGAGLRLDAARSIDAVLGGPIDLRRVWHQALGGPAAPALPQADRAALRSALEAIAQDTAQEPVDGAITFASDGPRARAAVVGAALEVDAATEALARGWLARTGALDLPVRQSPPAITQAEVDRALAAAATPASSGPLTVAIGDRTVTVTRAALLPALSMAPRTARPGTLDLVVDGTVLRSAVLAGAKDLEQKAKDAQIVLKDGRPTVIPSADGVTIDPPALAAAAQAALLTPERKASLPTAVSTPKLTTEQATALGVKEKVSTFSTRLTAYAPRTSNLRIAARTVNGTLVLPGKTFSLNDVLGKRTPEKGYAEAPTIMNGRLVPGSGGGVSQMATTIYNNVFFAGLEDVRHTPHSFYISRYPVGREATVNYPNVDLVWRNDSRYAVLVEADVTSTVNVSFWSTKQYDKVVAETGARTNLRQPKTVYDPSDGCLPQDANGGFDIVVRRKVYQGEKIVKDQSWRTSYIAEDKVVCGPKPAEVPVR